MDTFFWILGLVFATIICVVALAMLVASYEVRKEQKKYFKDNDIRNWFILLPLLLMLSCSPTNYHFTRLHESGTYTVDTRKGNQTTFKEVAGKYVIADDTLKAGDKISITVITKSKK